MKQIVITQPKLVADFSCVGGECREHCCQGWTIAFDKSSVNRYLNSKNAAIRQTAKTAIKVTKKQYGHWGEVIFHTESKIARLWIPKSSVLFTARWVPRP